MDDEIMKTVLCEMKIAGSVEAKLNAVIDYVHSKQRAYAVDAQEDEFRYGVRLPKCEVKASTILSICGVPDDPTALQIFEKKGGE